MKILSINAMNTKSAHEVAFNVDAPPAAGVMDKVSYGQFVISFEDGLLHARSRKEHPEIGKVVVENLSAKVVEAERLVAAEIAHQKRRHAAMIESVSKSTGLPVQ